MENGGMQLDTQTVDFGFTTTEEQSVAEDTALLQERTNFITQ